MSDLYDIDALAWAERQAELLRQLANGQRVNELIDWPNVIEEVQDVGLSQLHSCQSLLRQALVHLLKLQVWPDSQAAPHWRGKVAGFLADARKRFAPSMRQRIELDDTYKTALKQVRAEMSAGGEPALLAATCPLSLDDLLHNDATLTDLVGKLTGPDRLAPPPERA